MTTRSPERLLALAEKGLDRYLPMLARAERREPGFNERELRALVAAWDEVKTKGGVLADLSRAARVEVEEALEDADDDYAPPDDDGGLDAAGSMMDPETGETINIEQARARIVERHGVDILAAMLGTDDEGKR